MSRSMLARARIWHLRVSRRQICPLVWLFDHSGSMPTAMAARRSKDGKAGAAAGPSHRSRDWPGPQADERTKHVQLFVIRRPSAWANLRELKAAGVKSAKIGNEEMPNKRAGFELTS
jgi:hypothetical protein